MLDPLILGKPRRGGEGSSHDILADRFARTRYYIWSDMVDSHDDTRAPAILLGRSSYICGHLSHCSHFILDRLLELPRWAYNSPALRQQVTWSAKWEYNIKAALEDAGAIAPTSAWNS